MKTASRFTCEAVKYLLVLLVIAGCSIEEKTQQHIPVYPLLPEQVLAAWVISGIYLGVEEHGANCSYNGTNFKAEFKGLDSDIPYFTQGDPAQVCDPLENEETFWHLECNQEIPSDYFPWWNRWNIVVFKTEDAAGNRGYFDYLVDGDGGWWCMYTLLIQAVELDYA